MFDQALKKPQSLHISPVLRSSRNLHSSISELFFLTASFCPYLSKLLFYTYIIFACLCSSDFMLLKAILAFIKFNQRMQSSTICSITLFISLWYYFSYMFIRKCPPRISFPGLCTDVNTVPFTVPLNKNLEWDVLVMPVMLKGIKVIQICLVGLGKQIFLLNFTVPCLVVYVVMPK